MRLVGTTKPTILAIRERTHWNSANLTPSDPVTLGLCSQIELDLEVERASKNLPPRPEGEHHEETLLPAEETTSEDAMAAAFARTTSTPQPQEEEFDADAVFAKLNALKGRSDEETDEDAAGEDATGEDATDEASGSDETASAEQPGEDDEQR